MGGEKLGSQCAVGCFCDGGWFGCRCRRGDMGDRLRGLGCLDFLLCGWGKERLGFVVFFDGHFRGRKGFFRNLWNRFHFGSGAGLGPIIARYESVRDGTFRRFLCFSCQGLGGLSKFDFIARVDPAEDGEMQCENDDKGDWERNPDSLSPSFLGRLSAVGFVDPVWVAGRIGFHRPLYRVFF